MIKIFLLLKYPFIYQISGQSNPTFIPFQKFPSNMATMIFKSIWNELIFRKIYFLKNNSFSHLVIFKKMFPLFLQLNPRTFKTMVSKKSLISKKFLIMAFWREKGTYVFAYSTIHNLTDHKIKRIFSWKGVSSWALSKGQSSSRNVYILNFHWLSYGYS